MILTTFLAAVGALWLQGEAVLHVERLGSPAYQEREAASARLRAIGAPALPAVERGALSEDAEVRARCLALLPRLRFAALVADPHGKFASRYPGYAVFRAAAGWDLPARELFAAMQRSEGSVLRAAFDPTVGADEASVVLGRFRQRVLVAPDGSRLDPSPVSVLTYILVSTHASQAVQEQIGRPLNEFLTGPVRAALGARRHAAAGRRLLAVWAAPALATPGSTVWHTLIDEAGCVEVVPAMVRVLSDPKAAPYAKALAACVVARHGGPGDIAAVEALVGDPSIVTNGIPLGDVALAAAVRLRGWKLADFGFSHPKAEFGPYSFVRLGFPTASARAAALDSWKAATGGSPPAWR